jgi:hypothetical protein
MKSVVIFYSFTGPTNETRFEPPPNWLFPQPESTARPDIPKQQSCFRAAVNTRHRFGGLVARSMRQRGLDAKEALMSKRA